MPRTEHEIGAGAPESAVPPFPAAVVADAARRQWRVLELHRLAAAAVRIIVSAAGIALVLLVLSQIALDTFYPTIDIKPVSVPLEIERAGFKPDVVSRKLADELERIQRAAPTGHRRRTLYFDRPPLDLTMPGLGFSVSSISTYIKSFLSLEEVIVCDILYENNQYVMNIRDRKTRRSQILATIENKDFDQLVALGAKEILRLSDPYVLASYVRATDPAQAKTLLRDVLAEGDPEDTAWAYLMWGIIVKRGGDIDDGIRYYQMAVDSFYAIPWFRRWLLSDVVVASAYTNISIAYHDKNEMPLSTQYLRQAVDMGLDNAQEILGERYLSGAGVPRDLNKAELWIRRGASQGRPEANYRLALMYLDEQELPGDPRAKIRDGVNRLRYAAARGFPAAEERLGEEYLSGKHLPRDAGEAKFWFNLAAASNDPDAKQKLEDMAQQNDCTGHC